MEAASEVAQHTASDILPLQRRWIFWVHKPCFDAQYEKSRMPLHKDAIASIQEFWQYYNNIWTASRFLAGKVYEGYGFFEEGICPEWEDGAHNNGATLTFKGQFDPADIDGLWLDVLLFLVGETLPLAEMVSGVRVLRRNLNYRIEVWCKRSTELGSLQDYVTEWLLKNSRRKPKGFAVFATSHK